MDSEKVIKGLSELEGFLFKRYGEVSSDETHIWYDRFLAVSDALALLKEQDGEIKTLEDKNAKLMLLVNEYLKKEREEAVEPKVEKAILDYQSWHYICGDCGGQIDINDNYCRHCGRVVAHLSNKI